MSPVTAHIERLLQRHRAVLLAVLTIGYLASTIVKARAKPFWHDEIYTILFSRLPSMSAMWAAALDGIDLSPPLNAWITRGVHAAVGVGHCATRLPSMIGYWIMLVIVFYMVERRANTTTALAAALLPFFTAAYRYAYEARAYGLMLGFFALALHCWSEAARGNRRLLHLSALAAVQAAALWNHYYAVLTFVPIAAGEAVRLLQRRKIDVAVAAALVVGITAVLPLRPLVAAAARQRATFWSTAPAVEEIREAYSFLIEPLGDVRFALIAIVIAGLLVWAAILGRPHPPEPRRELPAHEAIAGVVMLLIPLLGVVLAHTITGAFVPRYILPTVVGFALTLPLAVWWANVRGTAAELLLAGVLTVALGQSVAMTLYSRPLLRDPVRDRPLLLNSLHTADPTVIASSLQFLELWYYTPSELKGRMRYLADPTEALKLKGSNTIDRGYLVLARWTSVPVEHYHRYVSAHREFRVYAAGSGWLLQALGDTGAEIEDVGRERGGQLYRVRLR